jgi:hypothetical protein
MGPTGNASPLNSKRSLSQAGTAFSKPCVDSSKVDATACELVKLRSFAGLSLRDAGQALELPARTADRLRAYVKAWPLRKIQRGPADAAAADNHSRPDAT